MADKGFVVELTGGQLDDPVYVQPVRAEQVLEGAEYLHFLQANGSLGGLFLKSVVRNWGKATEHESSRWVGRKPTSS
jgi:hypothetical protein